MLYQILSDREYLFFLNHLYEKLLYIFIKFVRNIKLDGVIRILDIGKK